MECAIKIEINEVVSLFDEEMLSVLECNLSVALSLVQHALVELRGAPNAKEPPKPIADGLAEAFKASAAKEPPGTPHKDKPVEAKVHESALLSVTSMAVFTKPVEAKAPAKTSAMDAVMTFAIGQTNPWKVKKAWEACGQFSYGSVQSAIRRNCRLGKIEPAGLSGYYRLPGSAKPRDAAPPKKPVDVQSKEDKANATPLAPEPPKRPTIIMPPDPSRAIMALLPASRPSTAPSMPHPGSNDNGKYPIEYTLTGCDLDDDFTLQNLKDAMNFPHKSGEWLADWNARGWIETIGAMRYRKTEKFPGGEPANNVVKNSLATPPNTP